MKSSDVNLNEPVASNNQRVSCNTAIIKTMQDQTNEIKHSNKIGKPTMTLNRNPTSPSRLLAHARNNSQVIFSSNGSSLFN